MGEFIGKRVVPRHDGVWDKTKNYEPLVIVLNETDDDSYISRRDVPAGTVLTDEYYWSVCSRFSEQMRLLADDVDADVKAMHKDVEDTKSAMSKELTETKSAMSKELSDTKDAMSKELSDTHDAMSRELTETEARMTDSVGRANAAMQDTQTAMNEAVEQMTARLDANISASTDADADYAAEVVDARVDGKGTVYPNLGEALRRHDAFLRPVVKPTIESYYACSAEGGNLSTATIDGAIVNGRCVAVDYDLHYEHGVEASNYIRARMGIDKNVFAQKIAGKNLIIQIYSSAECAVVLGFGYTPDMVQRTCYIVNHLLKVGYNEFVLDTTLWDFISKEEFNDQSDYLHIHWCFGNLRGMPPVNGDYCFRFSCYAEEAKMEKSLPGMDTVPHVLRAIYAHHAERADEAILSENAVSAGVEQVARLVGMDKPHGHFDETGLYTWKITKDTVQLSDMGFSVLIGNAASLKGKKLILMIDEAFPVTTIDMNLGYSWGNQSYATIKPLFVHLYENYWMLDFDEALEKVETARNLPDFEGDIYIMIYGNTAWDLSTLTDGEMLYNRYRFYATTEGLVYNTSIFDTRKEIDAVEKQSKQNTERINGVLVNKGRNVKVTEGMGGDFSNYGTSSLEYLDDERCNIRYTFAKTGGHIYPATQIGTYGELKGKMLKLCMRNVSAENTDALYVNVNVSNKSGLGSNPYTSIHTVAPLPGEDAMLSYDISEYAAVYKTKTGTDIPDDTDIFLVLYFKTIYNRDGIERSLEFFWYVLDVDSAYRSTGIAVEALHANVAEHAYSAGTAGYSEYAGSSSNAGAENIVKRIGANGAKGTLDEKNIYTWAITGDTAQKTDIGFSLYAGTTEELKGRTIILYKDETFPVQSTAMNLGYAWGGKTFASVSSLFTHLWGCYYAAQFDDLYAHVTAQKDMAEYEGDIYFMLYYNTAWDLTTLAEGETVYNRYTLFATLDGLVFDSGSLDVVRRMETLEKQTTVTDKLMDGLAEDMAQMEDRMKTVEQSTPGTFDPSIGNVLYGKKYVSCGDSFTQGDFSGWTDENGLSGKNSPVIYDADWKVYKTYPWWIAKRNNMTLVNEALCGSIMPLSKQYIAYRDTGEGDAVAEGYRNPFSYKRYAAIPEDADYITFWFGINDASNTNLGTIDDTTNETFYGA